MAAIPSVHVGIVVTEVVQQMAVKCLVKTVPLLTGDRGYFTLREKGHRGPAESWGHSPLGQPFPFSVSSVGALVVSEKAKTAGYAKQEALAFLWSSADRTAYRAEAWVSGKNSRM